MMCRQSRLQYSIFFLIVLLFVLVWPWECQAQFCSEDFRLHDWSLTLDAGPSPEAQFEQTDLPRWPFPYDPNRGTGYEARSCGPVNGSYISVMNFEEHEDYSPPSNPVSSVSVPLNDMCMPSIGDTYTVKGRMQLGHGYLGIQWCPSQIPYCFQPIAEDFYLFEPVTTECVRYCDDSGSCPEPVIENCPDYPACVCPADQTECQGDCDFPEEEKCPDGGGVYDHPLPEEAFHEEVAFLDIKLFFGGLPQENCPKPECCPEEVFFETNPIAATVYVDAFDNESGQWRLKAGTEFKGGSKVRWENRDSCTQADIDGGLEVKCPEGPVPPDVPGCMDECTNIPPDPENLPPDLKEPRIPIFFPVPAGRDLRVRGKVYFETCGGVVGFDLVKLLWNEETGVHYFTEQFYTGQHVYECNEIPQDDPETSLYITKVCEVDCDGDEQPDCSRGHGNECCGPEYSGLHGTMDLQDPRSERTLHASHYEFDLYAQKAFELGGPINVNTNSNNEYDKLFDCLPILPYDANADPNGQGEPIPEFADTDNTCGDTICTFYPGGSPECPEGGPAYGEWMFENDPSPDIVQANYKSMGPLWEGDYWRTSTFNLNLEFGKNALQMAPIVGLHGLLMDEDPTLCAPDFSNPENAGWIADDVFPNYNDIYPDLAWFLGNGNECHSPGLYTTNVYREVFADTSDSSEDELNFRICPADQSYWGRLTDKNFEPHFIRTKDFIVNGNAANQEAYPTWVPDRTLCSEVVSIRGIVRLIDGYVDPDDGSVYEIGLEEPWTMKRFLGGDKMVFTPPDWDVTDPCTQITICKWHHMVHGAPDCTRPHPDFEIGAPISRIETFPYQYSDYATSSSGAPRALTALQYLWDHEFDPDDPTRSHRCINEVIQEKLCEDIFDSSQWRDYFGMPQLMDPRSQEFRTAIESLIDSGLPVTDWDTLADSVTDLHFDNLAALTNNIKATASTRKLKLEFQNEMFWSKLYGGRAPVKGYFILNDVTKPIQAGPGDPYTIPEPMPASFFEEDENVMWPYIIWDHAGGEPEFLDSQINPRVGLDPADPWCDTTDDTDPDPSLHGTVLPPYTNQGNCGDAGRTLVDRYTLWPGDCRVENFGVCMGEMHFRFEHNIDDTEEPDQLVVQGGGYFNAVQDSVQTWAIPSTRPDLMTDLQIGGNNMKVVDINEDGVPDQYMVEFEFRRSEKPEWKGKGSGNEVIAFLPAGRYALNGFVELNGQPQIGTIPIPAMVIPCGGVNSNGPFLTVDEETPDCVQDGAVMITGTVHAPENCTLDPPYIYWETWDDSQSPNLVDSGMTEMTPSQESLQLQIGTYEFQTVLDKGCNTITIWAQDFSGECGNFRAEVTTIVTFDEKGPTLSDFDEPRNLQLPQSSCTTTLSSEIHVHEPCFTAVQQGCYRFDREDWGALDFVNAELLYANGEPVLDNGNPIVGICLAENPEDPYCSCTVTSQSHEPLDLDCTFNIDLSCGDYQVRWSATDHAGNTHECDPDSSGCIEEFTITDPYAPVWDEDLFPPDLTLECDRELEPEQLHPDSTGWPTADDNCPPVTYDYEDAVDEKNCEDPAYPQVIKIITRTWIATDKCGTQSLPRDQIITIKDQVPPDISGVPEGPLRQRCDQVQEPEITVSDNCDPNPQIITNKVENPDHVEEYGCGTITWTWIATDFCGNSAQKSLVVYVYDDVPPEIECPEKVVMCPDPDFEAPFNPPPANDLICAGPLTPYEYQEMTDEGDCPRTITRYWQADDNCGNSATCLEIWELNDEEPPEVNADFIDVCLWPPNHKYVCFDNIYETFTVEDDCGVESTAIECVSSQCDDHHGNDCPDHPFPPYNGDRGDGHTTDDCVLCDCDNDGVEDDLCVRAERAGNRPEGRFYDVTAVVADHCNETREPIGRIWVPRDQRTHPDCIFQGGN
ncbi:hypothetical protein ACFLU6_03900 [Acidobacteriota bacterium]